jgi:hypothetical protein
MPVLPAIGPARKQRYIHFTSLPSKGREFQEHLWVLAHAHQMYLPKCATKTALTQAVAQCKSREAN